LGLRKLFQNYTGPTLHQPATRVDQASQHQVFLDVQAAEDATVFVDQLHTDIKALEVLAHFQSATLARIPEPTVSKQELIA
jgi:hypothetical protein